MIEHKSWVCDKLREELSPEAVAVFADEPDKEQWQDASTGLPCLIKRNPMGCLCGYVGVGPDHPLFGIDPSDSYELDLEVHGGITFAGGCTPFDPEHWGSREEFEAGSICHIAPGDVERHWLGFDCGHHMDLMPRSLACGGPFSSFFSETATYRTVEYVREECKQLARQLYGMERDKRNETN